MATTRANRGQTAKMFFGVAFTDATGAAVDPSGTPTIQVLYVDPAGSLTSKATLNLSKQLAITGFWGAFLDVSNGTNYPAGDYQVVSTPTVSAIATVLTDTFEIDDAPVGASGGFIAGAYASEAQIRGVAKVLLSSTAVAQSIVLQKAVEAAREIDGRLRVKYVVPFSATYDDTIVLLNMWLGAAYSLENVQGQKGNENTLARTLHARVDEVIADILSGARVLSVAQRPDSPDGSTTTGSSSSTEDRVFSRDPCQSDLGRF